MKTTSYDNVSDILTLSSTTTQKNDQGVDVETESRTDIYGAGQIDAHRRDASVESRLTAAIKTKITARVNLDRAASEAAAAAALQAAEASAEDPA